MGTTHGYGCRLCGHHFRASDAFSYGFLGEVVTPVVCPEHGLVSAEAGFNVRDGEWRPEIARKRKFPCPECGVKAPRWNGKTCPNCASEQVEVRQVIQWD
jgi:hypothetical protein